MKNPYSALALCVLCLYPFGAPGREQKREALEAPTLGEQPVVTTVCELTKHGVAFDGKRVVVRAVAIGGWGHGIMLRDKRCKKGVRLDATDSVSEHDDFKSFLQALLKEAGSVGTPPKNVTAKFHGVFDYRPKEPRLKWWLQVDQISDVEVEPAKSDGH